jgi:hypothetical protein
MHGSGCMRTIARRLFFQPLCLCASAPRGPSSRISLHPDRHGSAVAVRVHMGTIRGRRSCISVHVYTPISRHTYRRTVRVGVCARACPRSVRTEHVSRVPSYTHTHAHMCPTYMHTLHFRRHPSSTFAPSQSLLLPVALAHRPPPRDHDGCRSAYLEPPDRVGAPLALGELRRARAGLRPQRVGPPD